MSTYFSKILITGAHGQLGTALSHHPLGSEFKLISCSHHDLDITQIDSIQHAIATFKPDLIINTAALVAVDKAEQEVELAMQINYKGTQHLAIACQKERIPLIHISTDYVFDGTKTSPYNENDKINPINVYGKSKYLGEESVRQHCEQHIILRISGVFSEYGHNFLKTILRLANERKELRIVADQITAPTSANDIAGALFVIAKKIMTTSSTWGTYHYCSNKATSWHQFAVAIIEEAKKKQLLLVESIHAIAASDYKTPAKRPIYSVLACDKIKNSFDITQPSWEVSMKNSLAFLCSFLLT